MAKKKVNGLGEHMVHLPQFLIGNTRMQEKKKCQTAQVGVSTPKKQKAG